MRAVFPGQGVEASASSEMIGGAAIQKKCGNILFDTTKFRKKFRKSFDSTNDFFLKNHVFAHFRGEGGDDDGGSDDGFDQLVLGDVI